MDGYTKDAVDKQKTYVVCASNVPQEFFESRDLAKKYFRRFGKVKLVMFKPKKKSLVIEYITEDGMLNALEVAGEYKGQTFSVVRDNDVIVKKKKMKKDPDPDWIADPEVRAELEAMGAFGMPKTYNLRGEAMAVDPVDASPGLKKQRKWKGAVGITKLQKKKVQASKEILGSMEQTELLKLIRQQALTSEDKFKILDGRDKLIRLNLKNSRDLPKATATSGTCPDMCPEKERLQRESQHQVALYEQGENREMNPKLAVKQYSRSSADQEAPLPQELRPVEVLQMTMGYLLHRIVGMCDTVDVNLAEWYHFLWDRTRGIRKDITQQELCCQGSVELVEQCARFHIFCSARLVAEDVSVFDQKINTENLTKCLQTLKYMYHDLQVKGISCANEAEFRAYVILLNLNDGNFMWEVQQLKPNIQRSKEIRFALEVYSSLDKQNYVKFFKLVKSTTHLNACILMRYFIQVRTSATKTLLKSYSPRISQTALPISYLTNILAFENTDATVEFFEAYGLYTNVERTRIVLSRPSFSHPEYPYVLDRAIKLVESKRQLSIGELVCGRPLPPKTFESHVPQNSFDEEGYLIFTLDVDEIETQETQAVEEHAPMEEDKEELPPQPPQPFTENIFASPKQPESSNIFINPLWPTITTSATSISSGPTSEDKVDAVLDEERGPSEEELEELRRRKQLEQEYEERERQRIRQIEEEEREEAELRRQLLEQQRRVEEERREAAAALRRKVLEEEQRKKDRERLTNLEIKVAVKDVVNGVLKVVEERMKNEQLAEISKRIYERKLKKVLNKWRENTRRTRKRKAIDFSPSWFGQRTVHEEADELRIGSLSMVLANIKRYKTGRQLDVLAGGRSEFGKIDLTELTHKQLSKKYLELDMKLCKELFWKVTISMPTEAEFKCGLNHIEAVLDSCIRWKQKGSTVVAIEQSKTSPTITYCLEKQKGLAVNHMNDTNGFIFIANELNLDLRKRVIANFRNCGKLSQIPAVFALQRYAEDNPHIKSLISEGIISDYLIIVNLFSSKNLLNMIEEALIFLSTKIQKRPPLEMDTLQSFLDNYLCSDLWKRANSFSKWNSNYKNCLKIPNTAIFLHNEALDRLKKILLDDTYREQPKFPEIFKDFLRNEIPDYLPCDYKYFPTFWDSPSYLRHLEKVLNTLALPKFLDNWPPANQIELESNISKYCTQIFKEPHNSFYKIMSIFLKNIDPELNFEHIKNVMWSEVIELMTREKLNQTNFSLYGTGFVKKSIYNQLIVVYDNELLKDYVNSDWFYINNPIIRHKILEELQDERQTVVEQDVKDQFLDVDIDKIFSTLYERRDGNVDSINDELVDCKKLLNDLEESVGVHKKILEKSGSCLQSVLQKH